MTDAGLTADEIAPLRDRAAAWVGTSNTTSLAIMAGGDLVVDINRPPPASGAYDILGQMVLDPAPAPDIGLAFELLPNGRVRQDIASAHKSIVSMLVAAAETRGLLTLEDRVSSYLDAGWSQAPADVESQITLFHLLTMTSGLDNSLRSEAPPGTVWNYTLGPAWHMLKRVLPRAAGMDLAALSEDWLFGPLGLTDTVWSSRPGMTYLDGEPFEVLLTHAVELARIGQVVLDGGRRGTTQLIAEPSIRRMVTPSQHLNPAYGLLWWLNGQPVVVPTGAVRSDQPLVPDGPTDLVAMLGMLGQICAVIPSRGMVVTRIGGLSHHHDAHIGLGLLQDLCRDLIG